MVLVLPLSEATTLSSIVDLRPSPETSVKNAGEADDGDGDTDVGDGDTDAGTINDDAEYDDDVSIFTTALLLLLLFAESAVDDTIRKQPFVDKPMEEDCATPSSSDSC